MRYAYCHPTVMAGEMTHNARDTEARGNKGLQATLAKAGNGAGWAYVVAKDYQGASSVFFGDRPLENPGYSEFVLRGDVGVEGALNDILDVYRVEQRLKYLGYPVYKDNGDSVKSFIAGDKSYRVPNEFKVDGIFTSKEESALIGFHATTHYYSGLGSSGFNGYAAKINKTADAKNVFNGTIENYNNNIYPSNLAWLNSYNAPHLMNVYSALGIDLVPGASTINYKDRTSTYAESYGSSWVYDGLKAWEVSKSKQGLSNEVMQINGLTSPVRPVLKLNGQKNEHGNGGHSAGMGVDWGFGIKYIDDNHQGGSFDQAVPTIDSPEDKESWIEYAIRMAKKLPNQSSPAGNAFNNQAGALRNMLSFYAATIKDLRFNQNNGKWEESSIVNNGTWEELPVVNGEVVRNALFGSGLQDKQQLIQNFWVGGDAKVNGVTIVKNHYKAMHAVMTAIGIKAQNGVSHNQTFSHYNHYHIDIRPPNLVGISSSSDGKLLAGSVVSNTEQVNSQSVISELITEVLNDLELTGENSMITMLDIPESMLQHQIVLVAQASAKQVGVSGILKSYTVGVCKLVPNYDGVTIGGDHHLSPAAAAINYLWDYEYKANDKSKAEQDKIRELLLPLEEFAKITILKQPQHGSLIVDGGVYAFSPESGYYGKDRVTIQVQLGSYKVRLNYHLAIVAGYYSEEDIDKTCGTKGVMWRVKPVNNSDLMSVPTSFRLYNDLATSLAIRDLTGAAVGETVGEGVNATITLDTDAAGHGWYIGGLTTEDRGRNLSTPSSIFNPLSSVFSPPSSDWLPTSNPNEWVAKAGTDAAGKMDMLSVLLHEYGHALGIDHSIDAHDYMATTLTPGMRRLPSSDDMQLMAQLAGEAREAILAGNGYTLTVANSNTDSPAPSPDLPISMGFGISFLGLLRRNNGSAALQNTPTSFLPLSGGGGNSVAQYDIAANAKLTNGNFTGNNTNAWETTGKVNANNGAAVLTEVSTSQTRLNQVFVVGADDRYLSFTLSNIGLEDVNTGPDDAFEVALLNANTGASLTAPIGLTRTDALLNIQANGAELKATGVTSVINADGSRTYVVDLQGIGQAGIAVGTAVNLSFDLIGFGNTAVNTNSHVSVRDVRLTGAVVTPQTNDDIAMGVEDTVMQIIALANDLNIVQANTSFDPIIVAAPMHGTVVIMRMAAYICIAHMRDLHKSLAINQA